MKALASVGVLVAVTLGLSAWLGGERASASRARSPFPLARRSGLGESATVRSSRLFFSGQVRCTAIVGSEVQVGRAVRIKFVLHNRSKRWGASVAPHWWLVLRAADGTTYDTRTSPDTGAEPGQHGAPSPPPIAPIAIRPGATKHFYSPAVPVRWRGPLRITPGCLKPLPALRVRVNAPGPPSDTLAAIDEVVAASGHLLDQCRPQTPGVPVDGQIDPPSGRTPPMPAQCSLSFTSEGAFWVAQLLVVSPPGPAGLQIWQPYETLWQPSVPPPTLSPPYEAIAWEFVVSRGSAIPVAAATADAAYPSNHMAPFWYWSGTGWHFGGTDQCGGSFFLPSLDWGFTGPNIRFISACPAPTP